MMNTGPAFSLKNDYYSGLDEQQNYMANTNNSNKGNENYFCNGNNKNDRILIMRKMDNKNNNNDKNNNNNNNSDNKRGESTGAAFTTELPLFPPNNAVILHNNNNDVDVDAGADVSYFVNGDYNNVKSKYRREQPNDATNATMKRVTTVGGPPPAVPAKPKASLLAGLPEARATPQTKTVKFRVSGQDDFQNQIQKNGVNRERNNENVKPNCNVSLELSVRSIVKNDSDDQFSSYVNDSNITSSGLLLTRNSMGSSSSSDVDSSHLVQSQLHINKSGKSNPKQQFKMEKSDDNNNKNYNNNSDDSSDCSTTMIIDEGETMVTERKKRMMKENDADIMTAEGVAAEKEKNGVIAATVVRMRETERNQLTETPHQLHQQHEEEREEEEREKQQRKKPQVPPKPQLDVVRYSMANAKDDMDLDVILSELLELEDQLCSEAGNQLLLGLPTLPKSALSPRDFQAKPIATVQNQQKPLHFSDSRLGVASVSSTSLNAHSVMCEDILSSASGHYGGGAHVTSDTCASPDADSAFGDSSSTDYSSGSSIAGSTVHQLHHHLSQYQQNGLIGRDNHLFHHPREKYVEFSANSTSHYSHQHHHQMPSSTYQVAFNSCYESTSTGFNNLNNVTDEVCARAGSAVSSSTGAVSPRASSAVGTVSVDLKAQKIREALEKMKEAKMKKIYVKIFLENGATKGILVDERWTTAETMRQLAERLGATLTPDYAIVEEYPDLLIQRIYEDHEFVVENIEDWLADSKNKLYFRRVPNRFEFLRRPEDFLLGSKLPHCFEHLQRTQPELGESAHREWLSDYRNQLIKIYLADEESSAVHTMEMDGWLLLKVDGRKSWRRHYFVLRSSGLYYNPKAGRQKHSAKDLQCLMNVYNNQIYTCTDWKKKYKAPTEYGFAVKHPRIQVKTSKYIKYICAEDKSSFEKWVTALRIVRNGFKTLHKNFEQATCRSTRAIAGTGGLAPIHVDVPNITDMQRLSSTMELSLAESPVSSNSLMSSKSAIPDDNGNLCQSAQSFVTSAPPFIHAKIATGMTNEILANDASTRDCSPAGTFFAQNECGTIKKQPIALEANILSTLGRRGQMTPKITRLRFAEPAEEERDSDEEPEVGDENEEDQLPLPPSQTQLFILPNEMNSSTNTVFPMSGTVTATPRKMPPPAPPPRMTPFLPCQQQQQVRTGSPSLATTPVVPQMGDLYAELQKATAWQKKRLEQMQN